MPILQKVRGEMLAQQMLIPGDRVLVAVSGGPDSVALAHLLHRLAPEWQLSLFLFHLDHSLRGEASREDAAYVARLAERLGLPLTAVRLEPGELERQSGSLEANARRRRYAEIRRAAAAVGAGKVAMGHNRDDQAETVLMRLIRGSGTTGLAGIPPVRPEGDLLIIRPLLSTPRSEIEHYCRVHELNPRRDASNEETDYLRNRIRLQLLPLLAAEYNESVAESLSRTAAVLREEDALLEGLAGEALARCRLPAGQVAGEQTAAVELDGLRLLREPTALARRVVRLAAREVLGPESSLGLATVTRVLEMAGRGDGTHRLCLPGGLWLTVAYGRCRFERAEEADPEGVEITWPISPDGETVIPELGLTVRAGRRSAGEMPAAPPPNELWLDAGRLPGPLAFRFRRSGDRLWPEGLTGSKKLQDILVDAKIPREQRRRLPLLTAGDEILWVPGVKKDRRYLVKPGSVEALCLVLETLTTDELHTGNCKPPTV